MLISLRAKKIKACIKKHYHWQASLLICLCIILFYLLNKRYGFINFDFSNFVLLATFFSIIWYSFETRELRIVTQRQIEPILFFYLSPGQHHFNLSNIGETPAFNVFICPIVIGDSKFEFNLLRPIYEILPGDKNTVQITKSLNLTRFFNMEISNIRNEMQNMNIRTIELIVRYDTLFGVDEEARFIFDITGYLTDADDSARECKIYVK